MDEHALRVTGPVLEAFDQYEKGRLSVPEVQGAVSAAAGALDDTHADLIAVLRAIDADLEMVEFAMPQEAQLDTIRRLAALVRNAISRAQVPKGA